VEFHIDGDFSENEKENKKNKILKFPHIYRKPFFFDKKKLQLYQADFKNSQKTFVTFRCSS
jgi:hypothetical protein